MSVSSPVWYGGAVKRRSVSGAVFSMRWKSGGGLRYVVTRCLSFTHVIFPCCLLDTCLGEYPWWTFGLRLVFFDLDLMCSLLYSSLFKVCMGFIFRFLAFNKISDGKKKNIKIILTISYFLAAL